IIVGSQGPQVRAEMYYGMQWNGAIFALLGPMIGYGFTSMGQYFPLALGLGLTRREFATGVSMVFLGNAVVYSVLIDWQDHRESHRGLRPGDPVLRRVLHQHRRPVADPGADLPADPGRAVPRRRDHRRLPALRAGLPVGLRRRPGTA